MKSTTNKIQEWTENHKTTWVVTVLVVLITVSFGLGWLLSKESNPTPVIIEQRTSTSTQR